MAIKDKVTRNERQRILMERLRRKRRIWLDDLKDKPCERCNIKYPPYVMEFHHRDPSQKIFNISRAIHISSIQKILDEIKKCDLYCSNCHKIVEYERLA